MSECRECDRWEEKYDNLYRRYDRLSDSYHKLDEKYNKLDSELDYANSKIRTELESRIKSEKLSYDIYVTSGGGDECYQNGMNGHCGFGCSIFGDKPECFENVTTNEQILEIYKDYTNTGYILELIEEYGLEEEVKEIDREYLREQINKRKEYIEEYKQDIKKWEEELLNI